jgi:hypothetical protein
MAPMKDTVQTLWAAALSGGFPRFAHGTKKETVFVARSRVTSVATAVPVLGVTPAAVTATLVWNGLPLIF